jgi:hypothetical protein
MPSEEFSDGRVTRCALKCGNEYQELKFTERLNDRGYSRKIIFCILNYFSTLRMDIYPNGTQNFDSYLT